MPRLNGKFASRGKYAEALASKLYVEIDHGIAVSTTPEEHVTGAIVITADEALPGSVVMNPDGIVEHVTIPEETSPVSVEETKTRKPRTSDPITSATVAVRQAKKELDRAKAYWSKTRNVPPTVEEAQAAYDSAVSVLQDTLNV